MVISPWRQTTGAWHAPVLGRQGEAEDALRRNLQGVESSPRRAQNLFTGCIFDGSAVKSAFALLLARVTELQPLRFARVCDGFAV